MITVILIDPVDNKKDLMMVFSISIPSSVTETRSKDSSGTSVIWKQPAFEASKLCLASSLEDAVGEGKSSCTLALHCSQLE